jgi:hypothetical protein
MRLHAFLISAEGGYVSHDPEEATFNFSALAATPAEGLS